MASILPTIHPSHPCAGIVSSRHPLLYLIGPFYVMGVVILIQVSDNIEQCSVGSKSVAVYSESLLHFPVISKAITHLSMAFDPQL
jgi:hypothetical protein